MILNLMLNQSLDHVFQALADPTRRAMLERLSKGPASVGELAAPLAISLPGVMQHLAALEACGLISTQKIGRVRRCQIEPKGLSEAETWMNAQRAEWESRFDRLGAYLEQLQNKGGGDEPAR